MSGLNIYYRPQTWDEVVGNEEVVASLKGLMQREVASRPHSFLLSGSRGCGKTTMAYLMGKDLGCYSYEELETNPDFREFDTGSLRGIDTIRGIREDAKYAPMQASNIVFMLDECFAKGTIVNSPYFNMPIETIEPGDVVYNLGGTGAVKKKFVNKVPVNRVARVRLSTGKMIFCTTDHLFFTSEGWVKAGDLNKNHLLFDKGIRVESIEIYQRGNNDFLFSSIIKDTERDQGFVEFYDLEIDGHPSYFVENLCVHNCHGLTADAQRALLKILEDPPPHVYFILCTTDPQGLIPTIRSRCTNFEVTPLNYDDMFKLLRWVLENEERQVSDTILSKIVMSVEGIPRDALVILDKVIDIEDEQQALLIIENEIISEASIKDLYEIFISDHHPDDKWRRAVKCLKGMKDDRGENDVEKIRRKFNGYVNAVILGRNELAIQHKLCSILPYWEKSFFYGTNAALTLAVYRSVYFPYPIPK